MTEEEMDRAHEDVMAMIDETIDGLSKEDAKQFLEMVDYDLKRRIQEQTE